MNPDDYETCLACIQLVYQTAVGKRNQSLREAASHMLARVLQECAEDGFGVRDTMTMGGTVQWHVYRKVVPHDQ